MTFVEKILQEGYGKTDKEEVLKAVNEIRLMGYSNPFDPRILVIQNKVGLEIGFFDGALWVSSIQSYEPGGGRLGMQIILDTADKYHVIVRLNAEPFGTKTLNKSKLIAWYKRLGFKKASQGYERLPKLKESYHGPRNLDTSFEDVLYTFLPNAEFNDKYKWRWLKELEELTGGDNDIELIDTLFDRFAKTEFVQYSELKYWQNKVSHLGSTSEDSLEVFKDGANLILVDGYHRIYTDLKDHRAMGRYARVLDIKIMHRIDSYTMQLKR